MKVLVAGPFSLAGVGVGVDVGVDAGASAADLLVRDVVCAWLRDGGIDHDVAQRAVHGPGVDWFRVSPARYSDLIVAGGAVGADLPIAAVIERFAGSRLIAVGVTLAGPRSWRPFHVTLERDGRLVTRPDIALAAPGPVTVPVVARIETPDPGAGTRQAHAAFDRVLDSREAAVIEIDTDLARDVPGRRSAAEVLTLLRRADVALTTRLDGLVLSLRLGVPVIAIDPVAGGGAITRQAAALRWPAALPVDALADDVLAERLEWCLSDVARARAQASATSGRRDVAEIETALQRALRPRKRAPQRLRRSRAE